MNGPYWRDLNGDRVLSSAEVNPNSVGLALGDLSFALVLASAAPGTEAADGLQWTALKAAAGSVAFVGVPELTLAAHNLSVDINLVSGVAAGFDADTRVIDFSAGEDAFQVVTGSNKTLTLDMAGEQGQLVRASGAMDLRVGNFFQFNGAMGLERRVQDVTLADGSLVKTEMLSVGGTGLTGFVGLGPYGTDTNGNGKFETSEVNPEALGLGVRDVEFGLAIFNGKDAHKDSQWLAMTGSVGAVDLMLGLPDDLKLQVYNLGVALNLMGGKANQVIDFADRSTDTLADDRAISITTGTGAALQLTHDGARGELMRSSGGMQLGLSGFVYAGGTLAIEKSSPTVTLANGQSVQTDMLSVGGTDLQMFVGVGGPYRTDSNGDGRVGSDDAINPNAIGLSALGGEFALGLFQEKTLGNPRHWTALQASLAEVGLVGVPGISAVGSNIAVAINLVGGIAAGSSANTQVIDFAAKPLALATGYGTAAALDMAGSQGQLIRASGAFEINLGDFVYANGTLGFEKSASTVTLANGSQVLVDSLSVGGANLNAFVGVGGAYHVDSNRDGVINATDTPNASARGFVLSNAEFALALLSAQDVQVQSSDSAAVKQLKQNTLNWGSVGWMGLEVSADHVGFVGGDALTIQAKNLLVQANQVFGLSGAQDASQWVVDFAGAPMNVLTGTGTTHQLDVDGDKGPLIRATGSVEIAVGDFFYVGGDLGFEKSSRDLVLEDGSTVSHDVMTVGGSHLQAFAGINGGPLVDTSGDGKIDAGDLPGLDAVGFSLSGVEFALVIASEREVVRSVFQANLDWQDVALSNTLQVALATGTAGSTTAGIYLSTDGGKTWAQSDAPAHLAYSSVSVSADGKTIVAGVREGGIVRSTDGGTRWETTAAVSDRYTDVALLKGNLLLSLDTQGLRDLSVLSLTGKVVAGDVIFIEVQGHMAVGYRVLAADLKVGQAKASADQALANVVLKLRDLVNASARGEVIALANGSSLVFTAKAGSEGFAGIRVLANAKGLRLSGTQEADVERAQTDAVLLAGSYASGDTLTLQGIAKADVSYKVVANDLSVKGDGSGGKASAAQIIANITAKLRKLIAAADGVKVDVSGSDALIVLKAKTDDTAFSLVASETAAKGSLRQTRADQYAVLAGSVRLAEADGGAWLDQRAYSGIHSANWSAVSAFDGGKHALLASAAVSLAGMPGRLYWVDLASTGTGATHWANITRNLADNSNWVAVDANEGVAAKSGTAAVAAGRILLAAAAGGAVYLADTSVLNWAWTLVLPQADWTAVTVSDDGKTLVASAGGGAGVLQVSSDAGVTWREVSGSVGLDWRSVALSGDGKSVTAVAKGQGIYTFTVVASVAQATRVALEASAASARLVGIPDVTIAVRDVGVRINLADVATGRVIDFASSDFSVLTGPSSTHRMNLDGANHEMVSVSAGVTIALADYVYLDGTAAFEKRSDKVTLQDGQQVQVDALTVGAANVSAFAGLGGAYRVDSNADGLVDGLDLRNPDSVGFSLSDANFGLGMFYAQDGQFNAKGMSLNGVRWLALSLDAGAVEVVGMPSLTLAATDFGVQVNQVYQLAAGMDAATQVIDFYATAVNSSSNLNAYAVRTGPDSERMLEMDGKLGPLLRVQGEVSAQVGDFLSLSGALSFEQSTRMLALNETADEVQRLSIEASSRKQPAVDPTKASGYRLQLVVDGKTCTTANLARDASVQTIQDALNTVLLGSGGGVSVERLASSLAQSEAFQLTGSFRAGDKIVFGGLASKDLIYTVTSYDLKQGTQGKSGAALDAQVRNNIAAQLRAMVNGAAGGKAYARGDADIITLTARTVGTAGSFKLQLSGSTSNNTASMPGLLNLSARALDNQAQRELLLLSGYYAVGDEVLLSGVADEDVVYTLVAEDFSATGLGSGGLASAYQVAHNLAEKLKLALAGAKGALANASVEGAFVKFSAVKTGPSGVFNLGVVLPASASMFVTQAARDDFDIRFVDALAGKDLNLLQVLSDQADQPSAGASEGRGRQDVAESCAGHRRDRH